MKRSIPELERLIWLYDEFLQDPLRAKFDSCEQVAYDQGTCCDTHNYFHRLDGRCVKVAKTFEIIPEDRAPMFSPVWFAAVLEQVGDELDGPTKDLCRKYGPPPKLGFGLIVDKE